MFPTTFNKLVPIIAPSPIFANRSLNQEQQISVERQLLVTLYRFGSFGNSASIRQVALWAGIGEGTVVLCTSGSCMLFYLLAFENSVFPGLERKREMHIKKE